MGASKSRTGPSASIKDLLSQFSLQCSECAWGPASDGRWRWAVNSDLFWTENPDSPVFAFLLGFLPEEERLALDSVRFTKDKARSLLGRLMMYRACAYALGQDDFSGIRIGRTFGKKPFLQEPLPRGFPNFNFNVSHDGRWVVLASDPLRLVGVDVSAPQRFRGDREDDVYLEELEGLLSEYEVAVVSQRKTVRDRYAVFQRIWSAKESVCKAVGQGIDFGLSRIAVELEGEHVKSSFEMLKSLFGYDEPASSQPPQVLPSQPRAAFVEIDQWPRSDWVLSQECLPQDHWGTVALGNVDEVEDHDGLFSATLRLKGYCSEANDRLPFVILDVASMLPASARSAFADLATNS